MKTEDTRITDYALGELRGPDREAFEQELATSEDLQRELAEAVALCQAFTALPSGEDTLTDDQRSNLRDECLKNTRIVRRQIFTRQVVIGSLAALAACLVVVVLAPKATQTVQPAVAKATAPAASPSPAFVAFAKTVANEPVDRLLKEAEGFRLAGRLDLADKRYDQVLNLDRYNITAREGMEQVNMARAEYQTNAYNETRGRRVWIVSRGWERPVHRSEQVMKLDADSKDGAKALSLSEPSAAKVEAALAAAVSATSFEKTKSVSGADLPRVTQSAGGILTPASSAQPARAEYQMAANAPAATVGGSTVDYIAPTASISGGVVTPTAPTDFSSGSSREAGEGKQQILLAQQVTTRSGDHIVTSQVQEFPYPTESQALAFKSKNNRDTEAYDFIPESPFLEAKGNPLSTFSIDVDTASYANIRRMLNSEQLPPQGAVRVEELLNYFSYAYPQPKDGVPFSVNVETSRAPWAPNHELVRIGLKGQDVPDGDRSPANLVFLIDVSGSMNSDDKLPLLKRSLAAMVKNLAPDDRVAIVVYAGSSGQVLPSTLGKDRDAILSALDNLKAGGSTNGASGIQLAYQIAREHFKKGGNNRVILCTDGDFNVGITNRSDLVELIEKERASGVFLSVLGFGTGNIKDSTMEQLADKGNGNYAYIDTFSEGRKVLVEQMNSTLFVIAKDVKIQVEFNPAKVAGYRLVGYENRMLAKEDFNDDKKDAGEIGAGHTVTALYEIVPAGQPLPDRPSVDPLKYQTPVPVDELKSLPSSELLTVKLRYKAPTGDKSELISVPVTQQGDLAFDKASPDFQFAAAVAAFGMKLRQSPSVADFTWADIQTIARRNLGEDPGSYRAEFLTLVEKAARLSGRGARE